MWSRVIESSSAYSLNDTTMRSFLAQEGGTQGLGCPDRQFLMNTKNQVEDMSEGRVKLAAVSVGCGSDPQVFRNVMRRHG